MSAKAAPPGDSPEDAITVPIDTGELERRLADREVPWPRPRFTVTTGSTNADLLGLAAAGAPEGTAVVADEQTDGRGRLGRRWVSAPGSGLWFSVLVRMGPQSHRGLLPLLAGVAVAEAIGRHGVPARLKWPNDIVVDADAPDGTAGPLKLGGILAESDGDDAVVVGIGVNLTQARDQLPLPSATSLLLEGSRVDRSALLLDILTILHGLLAEVRAEGSTFAMDRYRGLCLTIGRAVEVALPSGEILRGRAVGVGEDGQLHVRTAEKTVSVAAGDVIHATI